MLTVKVKSWDGSEEIIECERVLALGYVADLEDHSNGDSPESHVRYYDSRTVVCYHSKSTLNDCTMLNTVEGYKDHSSDLKINEIYVMNDKGRTISTF